MFLELAFTLYCRISSYRYMNMFKIQADVRLEVKGHSVIELENDPPS